MTSTFTSANYKIVIQTAKGRMYGTEALRDATESPYQTRQWQSHQVPHVYSLPLR